MFSLDTTEGQSCMLCRYYRAADEKSGICLRFPPQLIEEAAAVVSTDADHWCGEFAPFGFDASEVEQGETS